MRLSYTARRRLQGWTSVLRRLMPGITPEVGRVADITTSSVLTALSSGEDTFLSLEHIAADTMPIALALLTSEESMIRDGLRTPGPRHKKLP